MDRKLLIVMLSYTAWQILFPIVISPLVLGILTAEQMGYTLKTVSMGLLVGITFTVGIGILSSSPIGVKMYAQGLKHMKTREEFEQFWTVTLRGSDDGIIAETHWSGTILPLLMMAFARIGVTYPFNILPAIVFRWLGHVGAHLLFPRGEAEERAFGSIGFFAIGLGFSDVINSISFLISGNIIAPALLHHLSGYVSTWVGNKKKVAQNLGIDLE